MAISHAQPGEVVDLPLGEKLTGATTQVLVKTEAVEIIRLVVAAGKEIASHQARGQIVLQCLEGCVAVTVGGKLRELTPGELLWLEAGQPHAVSGIENSSLLLTILPAKESAARPHPTLDRVQEASEESFPASDPPSFTPVVRP